MNDEDIELWDAWQRGFYMTAWSMNNPASKAILSDFVKDDIRRQALRDGLTIPVDKEGSTGNWATSIISTNNKDVYMVVLRYHPNLRERVIVTMHNRKVSRNAAIQRLRG